MDSVSQIVLGGAVAYAVAGKTSPRKAILWGAVIATLPDLDVLVHHADAVDSVTKHRSWSHSWIVQTLIAPILALLLHRLDNTFSFKQWFLLTWLALVTHGLLDAQTVYGTQLFWPFMPPPYSGASIFIIDPLYTLPLLIGFIAVLFKPLSKLSQRLCKGGLIVSSAYLVWAFSAQIWVTHDVKQALDKQNIATQNVLVTPTPFNTLLWRIVVIDGGMYYEGFRSVFDGKHTISLAGYQRHQDLINRVSELPAMQRLDWFTHGFYSVQQEGNSIIASDLRMGLEPIYFFRFNIAESYDGAITVIWPTTQIEAPPRNNKQGLRWLWQRIVSADVESMDAN